MPTASQWPTYDQPHNNTSLAPKAYLGGIWRLKLLREDADVRVSVNCKIDLQLFFFRAALIQYLHACRYAVFLSQRTQRDAVVFIYCIMLQWIVMIRASAAMARVGLPTDLLFRPESEFCVHRHVDPCRCRTDCTYWYLPSRGRPVSCRKCRTYALRTKMTTHRSSTKNIKASTEQKQNCH